MSEGLKLKGYVETMENVQESLFGSEYISKKHRIENEARLDLIRLKKMNISSEKLLRKIIKNHKDRVGLDVEKVRRGVQNKLTDLVCEELRQEIDNEINSKKF